MIQLEELAPGEGPSVEDGNTVEVDYVGSFPDGKTFDKGRFEFKVGAGQVIQGFDMMVVGMKKGGRRKATIPPDLGYGARGAGRAIPPMATLVFDVTIVSIR
ncbi:FKBP-type peptidyl-prolyl cis-trans isomerase [bacterium]|nr:MAG: FKBP-type peptidyl-prolyl cis-trans isomerase [bacterium]